MAEVVVSTDAEIRVFCSVTLATTALPVCNIDTTCSLFPHGEGSTLLSDIRPILSQAPDVPGTARRSVHRTLRADFTFAILCPVYRGPSVTVPVTSGCPGRTGSGGKELWVPRDSSGAVNHPHLRAARAAGLILTALPGDGQRSSAPGTRGRAREDGRHPGRRPGPAVSPQSGARPAPRAPSERSSARPPAPSARCARRECARANCPGAGRQRPSLTHARECSKPHTHTHTHPLPPPSTPASPRRGAVT